MLNFKKIFFFTILIFAFLKNYSFSEEVNKVEVIGNARISVETIVIYGDIAIGKDYASSDINSLIKKLYETSFFSDISVELKNNTLRITVKENPIVNSIIFDGEKAKKFKEKLREIILLKEKSSFVENSVKQDINQIKAFYRSLGFYFVKKTSMIKKISIILYKQSSHHGLNHAD